MPLAEAEAEAEAGAEAWEAVLAALEADVAALGRLLGPSGSGEHDAAGPARAAGAPAVVRWAPPMGLGPLPERLAERARALEAAQHAVAARLEESRATAAEHLTAVRAIPAQRPDAPVYLDVRG